MPTATPAAILRAVLFMAGALSSLTLLAFGTRELTHHIGTWQIVFLRCVLGLAIVAPFIARAGLGSIRTASFRLQALRNVVHFAGSWCWYYGIAHLPLAAVFALEFTGPVWLGLIALLFLGERFTWLRAVAIVVGFVGIMVIVRPGVIPLTPAILVVLASAIGFAASHACVKKLTATDSAMAIIFYMSALQLPLAAIPTYVDWAPMTATDWAWAALVASCNLLAHLFFARALSLADATVVIPIDFLRLPMVALLSWLIYAEAVDPLVLVGAAMIVAGNYYNVRNEHRAAGRSSVAP